MNKSQVRDAVFNGLLQILAATGFMGKRKDFSIMRKTESGFQSVGFTLADYNPTFTFSIVMSLRIDEVEDVRNRFSGVEPQFWPTTPTVMLGALFFGGPLRFEVTSEAEIANAMPVLEQRFRESILPFLDAQVTLPAIERLLDGSGDRQITGALDNHAMAGVAAAALCRRPDFAGIVDRHRLALSGYNEGARQRFEALVTHVSSLA